MTNADFSVQPVTDPFDKTTLCRAIIDTLPEWFGIPASNDQYVRDIAERDVWASRVAGEPIGAIALKRHFETTFEIWWLGVKPAFHRRRVGTALLGAAEGYANGKNASALIVNTLSPRSDDPFYARTRRFYRMMGFTPLFEQNEGDPRNPMMWLIKALAAGRAE